MVELLLTLVILGVVAGLSTPVYLSYVSRNDLIIATENITDMHRRAQSYARSGNGDTTWGVAVQASSATLFKGATYATRDTAYDETIALTTGTTVTGLTEVLYSKLYATPSTTGTLTLTKSNESKVITVGAKGLVSYN